MWTVIPRRRKWNSPSQCRHSNSGRGKVVVDRSCFTMLAGEEVVVRQFWACRCFLWAQPRQRAVPLAHFLINAVYVNNHDLMATVVQSCRLDKQRATLLSKPARRRNLDVSTLASLFSPAQTLCRYDLHDDLDEGRAVPPACKRHRWPVSNCPTWRQPDCAAGLAFTITDRYRRGARGPRGYASGHGF